MVEQTDAEFIADIAAKAENATKSVEAYGASAPLLTFANFCRTAIPRLIAMVEERERERDEAKKNAAKLFRERRAFWDALIPPGPRCRDCADCNGRCQDTGHPCDPQEHALEIITNLKADAARAEKAEAVRDACIKEVAHIGAELGRAQAAQDEALREVGRLREVIFNLLENIEEPPDSNCSCHKSPPCNDCIDYAGLRIALKEAYAALASPQPPESKQESK